MFVIRISYTEKEDFARLFAEKMKIFPYFSLFGRSADKSSSFGQCLRRGSFMKRNLLLYALAFAVGGVGYPLIELLFRGRSHISMALAGGLSLAFIVWLGVRHRAKPLLLRALLASLFITAVELLIGIYVNITLHLSVWDYSEQPLNLWGQICLLYTSIWFLLALPLCALAGKIPLSKRLTK